MRHDFEHFTGVDNGLPQRWPVHRRQAVQGDPPPLLAKVIEIIRHYGRRIDDPSLEPPEATFGHFLASTVRSQPEEPSPTKPGGDAQAQTTRTDVLVDRIVRELRDIRSLGLPGFPDGELSRETIEQIVTDKLAAPLAQEAAVRVYADVTGQRPDDARLIGLKRAEQEAERARQEVIRVTAARQAKEHAAEVMRTLSPTEREAYITFCGSRMRADLDIARRLRSEILAAGAAPVTIDRAVLATRETILKDILEKDEERTKTTVR